MFSNDRGPSCTFLCAASTLQLVICSCVYNSSSSSEDPHRLTHTHTNNSTTFTNSTYPQLNTPELYPLTPQCLSVSTLSPTKHRHLSQLRCSWRKTTLTHNVSFLLPTSLNIDRLTLSLVYPAHLAFVLLNEGAGDTAAPGGVSHAQTPLFASVIQKAGGDVVSLIIPLLFPFVSLTSCFSVSRQAGSPKTHRSPTLTISRTRRSLPVL